MLIKELLPTLGKPTNPASASSFNSILRTLSSPGAPYSLVVGAFVLLVLNAALPFPPLPPLATIASSPFLVKSQTIKLVP